jgi:alcohol dehydrogenase, propanol-preferring
VGSAGAPTVPAMRALELSADGAALTDVDVPDPRPGEVLVKVGGAGLCHSDLHLMHIAAMVEEPFTLGHETAGWVEAVGPGTTDGPAVGEAVLVHGAWGCGRCARCRAGEDNLCPYSGARIGSGLFRDGGMAEYLLVPAARHLLPIADLDPRDAAPLDDAALTPYHAIKAALPLLGPAATAVVIGIGGLGHLAVQLLRVLSPATVAAVDVDETKLALAREKGADVALSPADDAAARIRDAAGELGPALVIDCVGSDDTLALAGSVVTNRSRIVVVGVAGGTLPFSFFALPYECSIGTTFWGTIAELAEVVALARDGRITVEVEQVPLDGALDAYGRLEAGTFGTGRAVALPHG